MKKRIVLHVYAPTPRLTLAGLTLLSLLIALPVGVLLWVLDWIS